MDYISQFQTLTFLLFRNSEIQKVEMSESRKFCHPNKNRSHIPKAQFLRTFFFGENGFLRRGRGFWNRFLFNKYKVI